MSSDVLQIFTEGVQKTVKEKIINILSFEWPLTTKEIYSKVTKTSSTEKSYQAIHKALSELVEKQVIEKKENGFMLKKEWIKNCTKYFSYLNDSYIEQKKTFIDKELKTPSKIIFNDVSELTITIAEWFAEKTFVKEGPSYPFGIFRHAWWPSRFNFKDFQLLLRITRNTQAKNGGHVIVKENTPFDKWILNQYIRGGFKDCKYGINADYINDDFFIQGDIVYQVKLSEETKKYMDDYYSKVKNLQDLYRLYTIKKTERAQLQMEVTIMRNLQFATVLRNIVLSYFT